MKGFPAIGGKPIHPVGLPPLNPFSKPFFIAVQLHLGSRLTLVANCLGWPY